MIYFRTRYGAGVGMEETRLDDFQIPLWCAAFGVDSLDDIFDLTPSSTAIPVLDLAIRTFHHDPESLRPLLSERDTRGLSRNVRMIEQMRDTLATYSDASITGLLRE